MLRKQTQPNYSFSRYLSKYNVIHFRNYLKVAGNLSLNSNVAEPTATDVKESSTSLNKCFRLKDTKNKAGIYENHTNLFLNKLNPWFITGLSDSESSFMVNITKKPKSKTGYDVGLSFSIGLNEKDKALLENIQSYFGIGKIYKHTQDSYSYRVRSVKDLQVIIAHFDKYPLITQKFADYLLFKEVVSMIQLKKHLSKEGLEKIVGIRGSINRGLSNVLKVAFPNVVVVKRPLIENQIILHPQWLAGFVSGDGCFYIKLVHSSVHRIGFRVQLSFIITQHIRDEQLMKIIKEFLGCGFVYNQSNQEAVFFKVESFSDISDKIIPFFTKYSILGVKALDFSDFIKVANLIKDKNHLNHTGLDKIRIIKAGMNKGRRIE